MLGWVMTVRGPRNEPVGFNLPEMKAVFTGGRGKTTKATIRTELVNQFTEVQLQGTLRYIEGRSRNSGNVEGLEWDSRIFRLSKLEMNMIRMRVGTMR